MRRINRFSINKESYEDMLAAGRFNPSLEITFRDKSGEHTQQTVCGYADALDIYRVGMETYVLSTNSRLDYVGLEIFEGPDKTGEFFVEGHQVKEVLGRDDLAPFNIIKKLREYII